GIGKAIAADAEGYSLVGGCIEMPAGFRKRQIGGNPSAVVHLYNQSVEEKGGCAVFLAEADARAAEAPLLLIADNAPAGAQRTNAVACIKIVEKKKRHTALHVF